MTDQNDQDREAAAVSPLADNLNSQKDAVAVTVEELGLAVEYGPCLVQGRRLKHSSPGEVVSYPVPAHSSGSLVDGGDSVRKVPGMVFETAMVDLVMVVVGATVGGRAVEPLKAEIDVVAVVARCSHCC